jgi:hypothetical protein
MSTSLFRSHKPPKVISSTSSFKNLALQFHSHQTIQAKLLTHLLPKTNPLQQRTMSDDASYSAFLSKANEPPSTTTTSTSQQKSRFDPTSTPTSGTPGPIATLLSSSPSYVSETDSPFHPFFASYSGNSLPSAGDFAKCAGNGVDAANVERLSVEEFDPRGEYKEVVEAVRAAGREGKGDVGVYRLEVSSTRIVYFVVTLEGKGGKIVGVKVESVES